MKKLIELKLRVLARLVIRRYKPEIIGITGSVGKTSAKEAIFAVLSPKFQVRKSEKNYNNEIGLPLAIIGAESPGRSFFGWGAVFFRAFWMILFKSKNYPRILVLEMGADKPGDISYLLKIVKPKIGVITSIGESHLEFFKTVEGVKKEKGTLVRELKKDSWAVLNFDDPNCRSLVSETSAKIMTYGFGKGSDVWVPENGDNIANPNGASFKLQHQGSFIPVLLPGAVGRPAMYAALIGAAVGIIYGLNLVEISKNLSGFRPARGRMNLIPGIKNTLVIDDTYNSSPQSSIEALEVLARMPAGPSVKRFAVLGDMLELGKYTEEGHRLVGRKAADLKINQLIVVGERSRDIARGAQEAGMPEGNIFHFPEAGQAGLFVQERIKEGDIILVKGSQGARMEKIVKEIMAEPLRAGELLVRQDANWRNS